MGWDSHLVDAEWTLQSVHSAERMPQIWLFGSLQRNFAYPDFSNRQELTLYTVCAGDFMPDLVCNPGRQSFLPILQIRWVWLRKKAHESKWWKWGLKLLSLVHTLSYARTVLEKSIFHFTTALWRTAFVHFAHEETEARRRLRLSTLLLCAAFIPPRTCFVLFCFSHLVPKVLPLNLVHSMEAAGPHLCFVMTKTSKMERELLVPSPIKGKTSRLSSFIFLSQLGFLFPVSMSSPVGNGKNGWWEQKKK